MSGTRKAFFTGDRSALATIAAVILLLVTSACTSSGRNSRTPIKTGASSLSTTLSVPVPVPQADVPGFADIHTHMFSSYGFGLHVISPNPEAGSPCEAAAPIPFQDVLGQAVATTLGIDAPGHCRPSAVNLLGQQMSEDELLRAHTAGLNLIVMNAVNNKLLCRALHGEEFDRDPAHCDDMLNADRELDAAHRLQDRIDRNAGGVGKGWFRIVASPEEARNSIRRGQLAVVLGLEVSDVFCSANAAGCDRTELLKEIDDAYARGVRHIFPMHIYDNIFGGAAMHSCSANSDCTDDFAHWVGTNFRSLAKGDSRLADIKFPVPGYDCGSLGYEIMGGRCNSEGLTSYGEFFIDALTSRGMLIDVDHVSYRAREQILTMAEARHYPLVSSHTGFVEINNGEKANESNPTFEQFRRIINGGGMVAPILHQGTAAEVNQVDKAPRVPPTSVNCDESFFQYAQALQYAVNNRAGLYGIALGSDFDGFAEWPRSCPSYAVKYPVVMNGHTFPKSVVNLGGSPPVSYTYDISGDGFAHIGMYPDFFAQLSRIGVPAEAITALMHSAEGYIRLWERADAASVPEPKACVSGRATISSSAAKRKEISQRVDALGKEMHDTTGPNRGKPTPEQIAEYQALQAQLSSAQGQLNRDVAAYDATVLTTRRDFAAGKSRRACMTDESASGPGPGPGSTSTSAPPRPKPSSSSPSEPPDTIPPRCRNKPYLPGC